jgi:hypothetical protein
MILLKSTRALGAFLLGAMLTASPSALGAAQRTFVKSTGVDNPTCNLAAPCRSFAAAMLQTLSNGEVIVLDSAGYGPVAISQSVSIIAPPGVYAGITVSSGDGVAVAGAGITVVLQGLTINGIGTGNNGISFALGDELHVINCSISDMLGDGIFATAPAGRLFVSDTTLRGNKLFGVLLSGTVTAVFEGVRAEGTLSGTGIYASAGASMSVRESVASNNLLGGVWGSAASGTTTRITVDNTLIADNAASGTTTNAAAAGSLATLDVIRTTTTRNAGYGANVTASTPATAVMTVAGSVVSENTFGGIQASGTGATTAFASGNLIARNASAGIVQSPSATAHTRGDSAGEQTPVTLGTVTAVPGF